MKNLLPLLLLFTACFFLLNKISAQKHNTDTTRYIDPANMDLQIRPGDNFYAYANGNWFKKNPVPPSKIRWGSFDVLYQNSLERLRILCEQAARNDTKNSLYQRVGDLYDAAMDSTAIEKSGAAPLLPELDSIAALTSKDQILEKIATLRTRGIGGILFSFDVGQDDKNVTQYIPELYQGGTSLPDREYYLKTDARSKGIQQAYVTYIRDMFRLAGDDSVTAEHKAGSIMDLETALAQSQLSRVELRDPIRTYHKFSVAGFGDSTPGWNWKILMREMKVPAADSLLVNNPAFFRTADALFTAVPVDTWKAYLQWAVIRHYAAYLSHAFVDRQFEFSRILSGQKQMSPRWQRMSGMVDGELGELLGQLYVEKYFPDSAKKRMLALVENIQTTFGERIKSLDWMSDSTKEKALEKLHAVVNKIGYPDKWETYPGVVIDKHNLIASLNSIDTWQYNKMVGHMGKPVDKTQWGMTPPTINAYYNPVNNEIVFPAGILQFPFFDFQADDAVNYGGIAAVIGHELTHGFDDQGRNYDASGNLNDWWTPSDAKSFREKADKIVAEYNDFTMNDSLHVNGKLTLGENIADLGGVNIAYEAFKKTPEGQSSKKIDGFTPDQRFFLSWAQIWRVNILPQFAAQLILVDPHSPEKYRCNGTVTNMDAWYRAFGVKPGDKLYKPEDQRLRIW